MNESHPLDNLDEPRSQSDPNLHAHSPEMSRRENQAGRRDDSSQSGRSPDRIVPAGGAQPEARRQERRAWLAGLVGYIAFGVAFQAFPPFVDRLGRDLHVSSFAAGLTMTAFLAPAVLLAPLLGRACDRRGALLLSRWGFALLAGGGIATALAPSYGLLLAARVGAGLGGAMVLVASLKLLVSNVATERLGVALGVFVAGLPLGTAIAFDALAPLVGHGGWRANAAAASVVAGLCAGVFAAVANIDDVVPTTPGPGAKRALGSVEFRRLLGVVALGYAIIIAFTTWAPSRVASYAHLQHQTAAVIASLLLVVAIPFAPLWGRVSDRLGRRRPFLLASFAIYAGGTLMLPGVARLGGPRALWLGAIVGAMGVGCAMFCPIVLAVIPGLVDQEDLGSAYGLFVTAQVVGMALGPLALGLVFGHATTPVGLWTISSVAVGGLAATTRLRFR